MRAGAVASQCAATPQECVDAAFQGSIALVAYSPRAFEPSGAEPMVTRCPVQIAHLEAGGANVVRPAKARRTVRPVKLAVGFVAHGSTESTARNLADLFADRRVTQARMLLGNRGGAGKITAGQCPQRQFAGGRESMLLKRPSHPVIMSNTRSHEPPRASHLEQAACFKPLIDRWASSCGPDHPPHAARRLRPRSK